MVQFIQDRPWVGNLGFRYVKLSQNGFCLCICCISSRLMFYGVFGYFRSRRFAWQIFVPGNINCMLNNCMYGKGSFIKASGKIGLIGHTCWHWWGQAPRLVERDHNPSLEQVGMQSAVLFMVVPGVRAGKWLWAIQGSRIVFPSCVCNSRVLWGRLSLRNLRTVGIVTLWKSGKMKGERLRWFRSKP